MISNNALGVRLSNSNFFTLPTFSPSTPQSKTGKTPEAPTAPADNIKNLKALPDESNAHLSEQERKQVERLKQIDRKVRAHEAAHQAAAGSLVRGKSFHYVRGPDGKRYAVAGEVKIDIRPIPGDPEATIQKMEQVIRAALAPPDPSAQDRAIAAQAKALQAQARRELNHMERQEFENSPQKENQHAVSNTPSPDTQISKRSAFPAFHGMIFDTYV